MPPLPIINAKQFIKALEKAGFVHSRQKGSHHIMKNRHGLRAVIPYHGHKDIPRGTLRGILRDIEITVEELIDLLD